MNVRYETKKFKIKVKFVLMSYIFAILILSSQSETVAISNIAFWHNIFSVAENQIN